MRPWSTEYAGRFDEHVIVSEALRGNPLNDPHERPLWVYVPPGYDDEPQRRYAVYYVIQGFTGSIAMWRNRSPYRTPFPDAADALFAGGDVPPMIIVFVDAWTKYGGSQFVDSPGTGRYHTYLCDDVVNFVDDRYRTLPEPRYRAIGGKSSGGFGAMITPMLRPDLFGALVTHAGDALYELCYVPEFGKAVRYLRAYDGDIMRWWNDFESRVSFTKDGDDDLLGMMGVAACFSASDDGSIELPFDARTGQLRPRIWNRWLEWDPVRMVDRYQEALLGLHSVWIDAGTKDQWFLDLGAQAFRDRLREIGVSDEKIHFELFDDDHMGIEYRYPIALRWLAQRMAPTA